MEGRKTIDGTPSVVVSGLYRAGLPVETTGRFLKLRSPFGGGAHLRPKAHLDRIDCTYSLADPGDEPFSCRYEVRVQWDEQHLGGRRAWFLCPQPGCGRRAG